MSGKDSKIKELTKKIEKLSIEKQQYIEKSKIEWLVRLETMTMKEVLDETDIYVAQFKAELDRFNKEIKILIEELKVIL